MDYNNIMLMPFYKLLSDSVSWIFLKSQTPSESVRSPQIQQRSDPVCDQSRENNSDPHESEYSVKYCPRRDCLWFYIASIKSCLSLAFINNTLDIYVFQQ